MQTPNDQQHPSGSVSSSLASWWQRRTIAPYINELWPIDPQTLGPLLLSSMELFPRLPRRHTWNQSSREDHVASTANARLTTLIRQVCIAWIMDTVHQALISHTRQNLVYQVPGLELKA
jgi:hypothetical protein